MFSARSIRGITICATATFFSVLLITPVKAIEPPRSLSWGLTYDSVRTALQAADKLEVKPLSKKGLPKGYKEYSELQLPRGFYRAEIEKVKLLKKDVQRTYAVFDTASKLVAFQYILKWDNDQSYKGFRKCWVYFGDLKRSLLEKYGTPTIDETTESVRGEDMPSGLKYATTWIDSLGNRIDLEITRQTHNAIIGKIDGYLVFLIYTSSSWGIREVQDVTDDDGI